MQVGGKSVPVVHAVEKGKVLNLVDSVVKLVQARGESETK